MEKTYQTYRIEVVSLDRVRFEKRDAQNQVLEESIPANLRYQEKLEEVTELVENANDNSLNEASEVRKLGETLFDILFENNERCQDFVEFYNEVVENQDQFLRVELNIDEEKMPELAALPWEFMCLPARLNQQELWLGTNPKVVFSRHRALGKTPPSIQLGKDEKLRIALVVSSPSNLGRFNYQPVEEMLNKLARDQPERVEFLQIIEEADRRSINEILEQKPHIFHFIGHGKLKKTEKFGQIALLDTVTGKADWISADIFSRLFAQHRPGIVVLQACEGGANSASQAFASVAAKVVQENIAVVLAMQYLVKIHTANSFTSCFYKQVAKGYPVDIAAQSGRLAIALDSPYYESRDFATPVIFMSGQDGYLFQRKGVEVEPVTSAKAHSAMATKVIAEVKQQFDTVTNAEVVGINAGEIEVSDGNFKSDQYGQTVADSKVTGIKFGNI